MQVTGNSDADGNAAKGPTGIDFVKVLGTAEATLDDLREHIRMFERYQQQRQATAVQENAIVQDLKAIDDVVKVLEQEIKKIHDRPGAYNLSSNEMTDRENRIKRVKKQQQDYDAQYKKIKLYQGASEYSLGGGEQQQQQQQRNYAKQGALGAQRAYGGGGSGGNTNYGQRGQQRGQRNANIQMRAWQSGESANGNGQNYDGSGGGGGDDEEDSAQIGQQAKDLKVQIEKDDKDIDKVNTVLKGVKQIYEREGEILDQQIESLKVTTERNEKTAVSMRRANSRLEKLIEWVKKSEFGLYILIFTFEVCLGLVMLKLFGILPNLG